MRVCECLWTDYVHKVYTCWLVDEIIFNWCYSPSSLLQIDVATITEELQSVIDSDRFDFWFNCGYNKPTRRITIDDKGPIIKAIWPHYTYFYMLICSSYRKDFTDGTFSMPLSRWNPSLACDIISLWCLASFFRDHFVVQYSKQGSNGHTAEAVMLNWAEYINDCFRYRCG